VPRPRGTGVNAQARKRKAAKELQQKEVFVWFSSRVFF
jgi:hypothetical protein